MMGTEELIGTIEQVEPHGEDPTIETDPWDVVAEEFRSLGTRLRDNYRQVADEHGPSEDELRQAFATLAGAWSQVAESVGEALRDTEVRRRLKHTVSALATALGTTISGLGVELGSDEEE
jgi:hypothetical protein